MEFILEIFLGRFIIQFLGINTRYCVLKLFDKTLKKDSLNGLPKDMGSQFSNSIINAIVGFIALFLLFYLVGFIFCG